MVNVENIDKLIEWIKADQGKHFLMNGWQTYLNRPGHKVTKYEYCNTAFCLGGWIDQHLQREAGATGETLKFYCKPESYVSSGAAWLGIDARTASLLFYMSFQDDRDRFDELPQEERAAIAIKVLEHLKATGTADWDLFLPEGYDDDDDDDDNDDY